jgi:hypothetical protein
MPVWYRQDVLRGELGVNPPAREATVVDMTGESGEGMYTARVYSIRLRDGVVVSAFESELAPADRR